MKANSGTRQWLFLLGTLGATTVMGLSAAEFTTDDLLKQLEQNPQVLEAASTIAEMERRATQAGADFPNLMFDYNLMDVRLGTDGLNPAMIGHKFTLTQSLPIAGRPALNAAIAAFRLA